MPPGLPTLVLATWGYVSVTALGLAMLAVSGGAVLPEAGAAASVGGAILIGIVAYWAIIEATRAGDVSAIQPFRYSRLVFAMVLGVLVFGERPDALTLVGAGLIVASGLYAFARERARKRASLRA
jgi:drug/metabolite transporter (DMT)-like permease